MWINRTSYKNNPQTVDKSVYKMCINAKKSG